MKFEVMLAILFRLLRRTKASAAELADLYGVSQRSIYRYVEELIVSGVPINIIRGRNGGIFLPDTYKLPENFLSKEEYAAAVGAMEVFYAQTQDESLHAALEKMSAQQKDHSRNLSLSGNILVDSGTWGDAYNFSEKLKLLEEAVEKNLCLDVSYINRGGEESRRVIEPHILVYKQNVWYVYAWCRLREEFRLFKIGRIKAARRTGEIFEKRPFEREKIPLKFNFESYELIPVRLRIENAALPDVEEWLGTDNIRREGGALVADVTLPDSPALISKLASFGSGIRIESPSSLIEKVRSYARELVSLYEGN